MKKYTMNEMVDITKDMLNKRGVMIEDIASIVQRLQRSTIRICRSAYVWKM